MDYEHFSHAADVGVRGFGPTPAQAFEAAARGLFALLTRDPQDVSAGVEERIEIEAPNLEELLVAFLNELICVAETRRVVFGKFAVSISGGGNAPFRLTARAGGEPFDPARHEFTVVPKGATYTALRVAPSDGGWTAQCVIDV